MKYCKFYKISQNSDNKNKTFVKRRKYYSLTDGN